MARGAVPISPQQLDPLSWFTGPFVPLTFAGLTALAGLVALAAGRGEPGLVMQIPALVLVVVASLLVHAVARGTRRTVGWPVGVAAVATGGAGMVTSAIGYSIAGAAGRELYPELWWASFSMALVLGGLSPYLPARQLVLIGAGSTLVLVPVSAGLIGPWVPHWGPVSIVIIVGFPLVAGTVLTAGFSHTVVTSMQRVLEARSRRVITSSVPADAATEAAERVRLAQLTSRAVPFLAEIAERGSVDRTDRALAGQLARRLRDDLVTQAGASWLDSLEDSSRLVVIDPQRCADRLRPAQRTALRGFIRGLLETPEIDRESLLVELRTQPGGATAVAVSVDADLPDGRRIVHLAPYYLTLRMQSEDLTWSSRDALRVSFRFPPEDP